MSLLIKALETAEKEKRAEQEKKPSAGEGALALEIAPKDKAVPDDVASEDNVVFAATAVPSTAPLADDAENGLSLMDEAGLNEKTVTKRLVSNKAKTDKAAHNAEPAKTTTKSDAFNAAALASLSKLKLEEDSAKANHQKAAASAFVANHAEAKPSSALALLLLGVAGALAVWLGLKGYQYIKDVNTPRPLIIQPAPATASVEAALIENEVTLEVAQSDLETAESAVSEAAANHEGGAPAALSEMTAAPKPKVNVQARDDVITSASVLPRQQIDVLEKQPQATRAEVARAPVREPLRLVSKAQPVGVDPLLTAAYEAYTRGEDATAQQQYRQMLQKDVRNVDALLGMAAIAQRQGRQGDAVGWYQKVLETEPRNTTARAAISQIEADTDPVSAASRIKNMLALQPESANLYAALGNLYAAQQQWPAAQEAYFNASRFAPASADYAFNLAVSLDHLGKSGLALAQYERALSLLNDSGTASLDKSQLEARISALK
ncbi:MAG: hypothetical protein PHD12_06815 [Methylotenera sp.]|nr:hypothetical protein [Methylotenera sp.]